jgi:hypothetical protein
VWSLSSLQTQIEAALVEHEHALRAEQAVRGLDALDEDALQALLAHALRAAGLGVFRETPYPSATQASPLMQRARARGLASRERCDLVLTPSPSIGVRDQVWPPPQHQRAVPTPQEQQLSLFASQEAHARPSTSRARTDAASMPEQAPAEEACWLEVKLVHQFAIVDGFAGPNASYASELTSACTNDIRKLSTLGQLARWSGTGLDAPVAALVLVLFTLDEATATNDLRIALHRALDRGAIFRSPDVRHFPILDRIGNACCTIAVIPSVPEV